MSNINSKRLVIVVLVVASIISVIPVSFFILNNSSIKAEILVLYDENNDVAIKSSDLFTSLMTDSKVKLREIPILNTEDLTHQIQGITENVDGFVLIGHGSSTGFHVGDGISLWFELRDLILNNSIPSAAFLSCFSSLLSLNETEEMEENYLTFEDKIDYMVASYIGALKMSHKLELEDLEDDIYDEAIDNLEIIIDHAMYCIEPLWWGTTHNALASNAIAHEVPQELLDILSDTTQIEMKKANEADIVDQVNTASISVILEDPVRRELWLKHNYGIRGGITIEVFFVPVYTIPVYRGTAPDAAQNAYNNAVEAYKNKDYTEAGKQLSYAVHYGQDMTMPYHVYDYLTLHINVFNPINLITALITLTKFWDDYGDLEVHNMIESWAHNEWLNNNNFVSDILSKVGDMVVSFSEEPESIYECVEDVAKWTRAQKRENQMERIFKKGTEEEKREVLIPVLAKAIAFTASLYEKFIGDVCNAPNTPNRPNGPYLSYIGVSNMFKFETNDPDGDQVKFEINWGDNNIEHSAFVDSGTICQVMHSYSDPGTYNISTRAVDFHDDQKVALWSDWSEIKSILIEQEPSPPPEPSQPSIGGPTSVYVNNIASFSALSYDPENHFLIYKFDFGDGYIWYSDLTQSGTRVFHSHTYTNVGTRTLTVTVENTRGGTNQNSMVIEIIDESPNPDNEAPNLDPIQGPTNGEINTLLHFQFKAADPEDDDIKYEIDWGDSESSTTTYFNSGLLITESHLWNSEGFYQIRYRAQDEHGLWSNWSNIHIIQITDGGPIIDP
jgi:PKD repeat protein